MHHNDHLAAIVCFTTQFSKIQSNALFELMLALHFELIQKEKYQCSNVKRVKLKLIGFICTVPLKSYEPNVALFYLLFSWLHWMKKKYSDFLIAFIILLLPKKSFKLYQELLRLIFVMIWWLIKNLAVTEYGNQKEGI